MTRRSFLGGMAAAATLPVCAAKPSGTLKFCAFADIHYHEGNFPHDSCEWLGRVLDRAKRENCDMVIHMGDFCHEPARCREFVDYYNDFPIPCYHTIGNHDDDGNSHEETLKAYRLERGHYHFDRGGFRFVVLDTNYFERDGVFIHYSQANYHMFWRADQQETIAKHKMSDLRVSPDQLVWLEKTLSNSPHPCIITSHASFERTRGGSPDGPAVRAIIDAANRAHPGRVRLVINGHHHHDNVRILENVVYLDLNSASYDWNPRRHDKYPADYTRKWKFADHIIMWDEPISAIITMSQDGLIRVEGQKSRFHLGITPAMAGYAIDDICARLTTPDVQSFEIRQSFA